MKNKKIFALYIIAFVLMVIGVGYAFFSYISTGIDTNQIITGDIYLNYGDNTQGINILNAIPESPVEARSRVDNTTTFTISGTNGSNNDIYYEIDLVEGEDLSGRIRLQPDELRFDLYEVVDSVNVPLISNVSFDEFNNTKIWVDKIDKRGSSDTEYSKVYRLRMWISDDIIISDTDLNADYSVDDWGEIFGNVKIRVVGDFDERTLPYAFMRDDAKDDIASLVTDGVTNIRFNINENVESDYASATNKADLTKNDLSSKVYAYVDGDILYIESVAPIYMPVDASDMFSGLGDIEFIHLENFYTNNTTNMSGMFNGCINVSSLELLFDTSNVTNMSNMFNGCSNLSSVSILNNFNTSNVTSSTNMFNGCISLVGENETVYDNTHIDVSYAHIDEESNPGYFSHYYVN